MLVGHMKEIVRHPIKSFDGEFVQESKIMDYGLYGDRSHAYLDEAKDDFLTITQFPEMVRYQASFTGKDSLEKYPEIQVTTPEGQVFDWEDQALIKELQNKSNRKISTVNYSPSHVPIGPIAVENILLVTDASLEQMQKLWGKEKLDFRRFRPNLFIALKDKQPFIEEDWIGRRLKIGSQVELELVGHCKRCMIITVDPDNAERDPSLHKTLIKERKNNFGVYASVIKTGDIRVDDEVHLLD
ncbi:MOSC domain-containing protein [Sediminibacillus massiliensis]|uniref:MOSC domain-containing protein n=1 Tax=Sediminibacillus massiliensis TaxID=1926277 RepID=UPI000988501F|nr:MOSC domain-containing protein [Sediminibacillus massiliensis]